MLRVAMISPLPPKNSGESTYTYNLIESLARTGKVRIIAITQEDAYSLEERIPNVETHRAWKNNSPLYPLSLFRYIRRINADIVHVQFGPHGKMYGGRFGEHMLLLLLLLRISGIPTTTTLHSTWMPCQVEKRIREYHGLDGLAVLAPGLFRLYNRLLASGSTSIQLSTAKMDSLLRNRFLKEYKVAEDKVFEIPHPCIYPVSTPKRSDALKRLHLVGKKVVLVFGFIRREKGIEKALEAMQIVKDIVPDAMLLVAGRPKDKDGEKYLDYLKEYCHNGSLDESVKFETEYIPDEDVPLYFGASSIILAPYTESVGASGPIHNSAGYGVPIIASDVGLHMKESIGGNLILFKAGNSRDLAEKIVQTLTNTAETGKICARQVEYAKKESWRLAARRTLEYYRKTLEIYRR